jgi:uncharacterized membrane protein YqhA
VFLASQSRTAQRRRSRAVPLKAAAVVCLILLAFLAVVQVAHLHANVTDADHCPLCIVMHSVVPVSLAAIIIILVQVECASVLLEPRPLIRSWSPKLFIRPPPAAC